MASEPTGGGRGLRGLRVLLQGDLRPITVTGRSRPSRWSPLDTAAECEARSMHYRLVRDEADVVLVLDPRDKAHLPRRWDGSIPTFLDGFVVRVVDLRVSSLLRQRSGAPGRASYVPTSERLDPGTLFRFEIDGVEVARAVYGADRAGGLLIEDVPACGAHVGMPVRNIGRSPVMPGS